VRDLAEWTLRMVEVGQTGIYNADSAPGALTMETFLLSCKQVTGAAARMNWADDEFLLQQNVGMWIEMPLWIPENEPDAAGFFSVSIEKALSAGLTFRPLTDTIHATLEWANTRPADYAWKAGLSPERERELLDKYGG
jgi:2'-hydroxyisoflavone reductase